MTDIEEYPSKPPGNVREISILDGDPPQFVYVPDGWPYWVSETGVFNIISKTFLEVPSVALYVQLCNETRENQGMLLFRYKDSGGVEQAVPVLSVRPVVSEQKDIIELTVMMNLDSILHQDEDS